MSPSVAASAMRVDELEELRRADDRVRDRGVLDQLLLRRPSRAGSRCRADGRVPDDRQRDVVSDARGGSRRRAGCASTSRRTPGPPSSSNDGEFDTSTTTVGALQGSASPSPVSVLTPEFGRRRRRPHGRARASLADELRADEPGAADDDDLHGAPSGREGVPGRPRGGTAESVTGAPTRRAPGSRLGRCAAGWPASRPPAGVAATTAPPRRTAIRTWHHRRRRTR